MSYFPTTTVKYSDSHMIDAFGRARVSEPLTIFDSKQLHGKCPLFFDEVAGGGADSATHSTADAATTMTVDASGEYIIRQTKMRFNYQPGKSQRIFCTFVLGSQTAGVTKRIGYFNSSVTAPHTADFDGIYLEDSGSEYSLVVSKNGTPTAIAQSDWNKDKFDGTGPSGITIDFTKAQILFIDFEWLGVGRARTGFVINGLLYEAHNFNHANSVTSVYMSSPNHSIRYEIRTNGSAGSLIHICSSVESEGGQQSNGSVRNESTNGTPLSANVANTTYALLGIRLKSSNFDSTINLVNFSIQEQVGSKELEYILYLNPTVAGTFTYNGVIESSVEIARGATGNTVTNGYRIDGGLFNSASNQAGGSGAIAGSLENAIKLGATVAGVADTIVLCVRPVTGSTNCSVEGSLTWRELT